jgi:Domain of unknown function (DUF4202)
MTTPYLLARTWIDQAHSADPERTAEGKPAELVYADRVEHWVKTLSPDALEILLLAARCQHLERWSVPRASFPQDRVGYLSWRKHLYQVQADRARALLMEAGVSEEEADSVHRWVSKTGLKSDPGTQLLEDGAVLVFLEHHIADFAASHGEYPREKFIGILRKTWRKISPAAQEAAVQLSLAPVIQELIAEALADGSGS